MCIDHQKARFRHSVAIHGNDKSFEQQLKKDRANSKTGATTFSQHYPFNKPLNAEKGGWDGTFDDSLNMLVGIGIDGGPNDANSCLTKREGGLMVWSERTMTKLEESSGQGSIESKQLQLACYMFELMYRLMMGKDDAIDNGMPFAKYIGPINTNKKANEDRDGGVD